MPALAGRAAPSQYDGGMADDPRDFRAPIDLHTHSSVSDGTESPDELVRAAAGAGLGTVALTDHDSAAGWADAAEAASDVGITFIPGMELSTRYGWKSVHMLAYLFDPADEPLTAELERIREGRRSRAETMVARLALDYDLSWDDVVAHTAPGATVGRPHTHLAATRTTPRGSCPSCSASTSRSAASIVTPPLSPPGPRPPPRLSRRRLSPSPSLRPPLGPVS